MRPLTKQTLRSILGFSILALTSTANLFALEAQPTLEGPVLCARITRLSGQIQMLNSGRTIIIDPLPNVAVPCGGWISVNEGWIEIKHKDGHVIHLIAGSMIQVSEVDQITLFRGDAFVTVSQGNPELRVLTANARARILKGTAIVNFDSHEQETELVATESYPTLENRYLANSLQKIRPGELTKLNLRAQKNIPSTPTSISMASLRAKLHDLDLEEKEEDAIFNYVQARQDKKYASLLKTRDDALAAGDRSIANEESVSSKKADRYQRTAKDDLDQHLMKRWQDRVLAGSDAHSLLFPDAANVAVKINRKPSEQTKELKEKKKLLEALSEVKPE